MYLTNPNPNPPPSETSHRNHTIKVLGVGGAGGNAVSHLSGHSMVDVELAALNTDLAALAQCRASTKLVLGSKSSRGLGAGGDPERGRQAAEEDLEAIRKLCANTDVLFVVAGLGGGTGTGAGPVVARIAKECGALVFSIVMLPFDCEGARRQGQAQQGLQNLKEVSDGVICLPNQSVFKLIDEKTSLLEAFHITNQFVAQGVQAIWRLLSKPGLINVDFADLCSVTQGKHAASALVTVEASGDQPVRNLLEKLHHHPLIDGGQTMSCASGMLICITGGPELSMKDLERIMENIHRHAEHAHIIMGASIDPELSNHLCLTLVAAIEDPSPKPIQPPSQTPAQTRPPQKSTDLSEHLEDLSQSSTGSARLAPPPPNLPQEKAQELFLERSNPRQAKLKGTRRLRQAQLPLEIISKGRFEKSEPTFHRGEDLDFPTYIRRGVPLN
jgi:cell division protein FtsZ